MQKSIVWEGLEYDTEEHCNVNFLETGIMVRSEIEGWAGVKAVYAEYILTLNLDWAVREIEIHFTVGAAEHSYNFIRHASGHWTDATGTLFRQFGECRFVDISLTPFTNTLAIKKLTGHQQKRFKVAYICIPDLTYAAVEQVYQALGSGRYRYENLDTRFSAELIADEFGLVSEYPGLFMTLSKD